MLLKYSDMDIKTIASFVDSSVEELRDICAGNYYFTGSQEKDLSYLFLIFFAKNFLNQCTIVRNFID